MPSKKKQTKKSTYPKTIWLAPVLVALGILGLAWALNGSNPQSGQNGLDNSTLRVQSGGRDSTDQSQSGAGSQLQGAARTNDLIQGRDGNNLQPGTSVDALTQDATIQ